MKKIIASLFFALAIISLQGQHGYSSASLSMGKMRSDNLSIPFPDEIIIEEYMNYHRHQIKIPAVEEKVALDLRYEAPMPTQDGRNWLQIGIATADIQDRDQLPPVNINLVIDRSGSMSGERIAKAKQAAKTLVEQLRPKDYVSVVIFDNEVEVVWPAGPVTDIPAIMNAIDGIQARGSTNLNWGMITGYREALKHHQTGQTNKILILTDAITNTGVVDPQEIVRNCDFYVKEKEVDMTMIGVGVNFNMELSREMTASSGSTIHFLNDNEDLEKVFVNEIQSLLAPVGRDVKLEILLEPGTKILQILGYQPEIKNHTASIRLPNMNSGLTQVVLVEVQAETAHKNPQAEAKITFADAGTNGRMAVSGEVSVKNQRGFDQEVRKNRFIGQMAEALQILGKEWHAGETKVARDHFESWFVKHELDLATLRDADIERVEKIMQKYRTSMKEYFASSAK